MTTLTQAERAEFIGSKASGQDRSESLKPTKRDTDGDWAKMCHVINDFRWVHGHWPTRFRMSATQIDSVRGLFSPQDFAKITAKLDFITDASAYKAEDDRGASCGYRQEFLRAADWLGVLPEPCPRRSHKLRWRFW